jgi:hypothetical protein
MKHRQHHHRMAAGLLSLTGSLVGLVLAGPVPEANANDDKVFAAQFCVAVEDNDDTIDASDAEYHSNRVETTDDDGQTLICPIMRDIIKGQLDSVFVRLENHDNGKGKGSEDTECCVIAYDPLGEDSEEECETADETDHLQTLEIVGPKAEANGYFVLTCDLGDEGDAILSYRTSERE